MFSVSNFPFFSPIQNLWCWQKHFTGHLAGATGTGNEEKTGNSDPMQNQKISESFGSSPFFRENVEKTIQQFFQFFWKLGREGGVVPSKCFVFGVHERQAACMRKKNGFWIWLFSGWNLQHKPMMKTQLDSWPDLNNAIWLLCLTGGHFVKAAAEGPQVVLLHIALFVQYVFGWFVPGIIWRRCPRQRWNKSSKETIQHSETCNNWCSALRVANQTEEI